MIRAKVLATFALVVSGVSSTPAESAWYLALGDYQISGTPFGPNQEGVTLKFENDGVGAVKVTVANNTSGNPAGVNVQKIVFNVKDALFGAGGTPLFSGSYVSGFESDNIGIMKNSIYFGVGNELNFDIDIEFSPGFVAGMTSVFRFTSSVLGFDEDSFKAVNLGADPDFVAGIGYNYNGGHGQSTGLQIRGITGGSEGAVPIPASVIGFVLLGACVIGFRGSFGIV